MSTPRNDESHIKPFARIPTGVKGLDTIMQGGFLRGGIYLIMGPPGAGKTILSNQIGFHHVATGKRALYVSLLSEGHGRLFGHLKPMRFFDENAISSSFNFISAYQVLEKEGLDGLLKSLAHMVRQYKADLLFLDGVASAEDLAKSSVSFKKFVHDLNTVLGTSGCTAVLLSSFDANLTHPEHTMVDGIISLSEREVGMRTVRQIEIKKIRGSAQLRGKHFFEISEEGIEVYPRVESYLGLKRSKPDESSTQLSTGIAKLDELLGGGLVSGTVTSLLGAAGTGKTLLGSQFLVKGAVCGEPGLYLGFYETPDRIIRKVGRLGIALGEHAQNGRVHLHWQPPLEHTIDKIAMQLLEIIRQRGIKRLFIDGIHGLEEGMIDPQRGLRALAALASELRDLEVTTLYTEETALFPSEIHSPTSDNSAITDNIIYFQHLLAEEGFVRLVSVIKSRESRPSSYVHEFVIGDNGIKIGEVIPPAEINLPGLGPKGRP